MKIKVLFDKEAIDDRFDKGWGVSYLIGDEILFDTGEKFEYLKKNAEIMGVDLTKISKIVISHDHWDHTSGLWDLLKIASKPAVYICSHSNQELKQKIKDSGGELVEVKSNLQIEDNISSSGESLSTYKGKALFEQCLIIDSADGLSVICGCCHPGILNIIQKLEVKFSKDINCVLGGLHLMDKEKRYIEYVAEKLALKVKKIGACHCTGYDAVNVIKEKFKDNFLDVKIGMEVEV